MLKLSPCPTFLWIRMSFCCSEIKTSSSSFVTSNRYCERDKMGLEHMKCKVDKNMQRNRKERGKSFQSLYYLWVLQECWFVVRTAAAAVQQWLCIFGPAAKVNHLVPRFMDADQSSVDETANVYICEELAPVCERHPVVENEKTHLNFPQKKETNSTWWLFYVVGELITHQNSPSSATTIPRVPLSKSPTLFHSSDLTKSKQRKTGCVSHF